MTLFDLWECLKRYWKPVVGLPVLVAICTGLFLGIGMGNTQTVQYQAAVSLTANSAFKTFGGVVNENAKMYSSENPGISVDSKADTALNTVHLTASSESEEASRNAVNTVMESSLADMAELYDSVGAIVEDDDLPSTPSTTVDKDDTTLLVREFATNCTDVSVVRIARNATVESVKASGISLAVCLVIAVMALVFFYLVRKPLIDESDVEQMVEEPALGAVSDDEKSTERLLANIRFSLSDTSCNRVALIPLSAERYAQRLAEELDAAQKRIATNSKQPNDICFSACEPLAVSTAGAYEANISCAVVLVLQKWRDCEKDLLTAMHELGIAHANVIGFAFCSIKRQ